MPRVWRFRKRHHNTAAPPLFKLSRRISNSRTELAECHIGLSLYRRLSSNFILTSFTTLQAINALDTIYSPNRRGEPPKHIPEDSMVITEVAGRGDTCYLPGWTNLGLQVLFPCGDYHRLGLIFFKD